MEKKEKHFIKIPKYPGGHEALKKFIATHLKYPPKALEHKIEGTVQIAYQVNDNGKVVDAKIEKGLGYDCDEEALRLVKMLQFEKVKNRGRRVTATKKIKIKFAHPQQSQPKLNYEYKNSKDEKQNNNTITYTITINK